jgi:phthiodiolone/phenolphthiodiolone dimycocerosates ketoreductase
VEVQPAAFFRTTLPLDLGVLDELDSGRYHSIWLPDHMVSFWPDSIWTPEFTDLATVSPSPHRHLDGLTVAGAVAVSTRNVPIATSVLDTVRRHPASLAQSALTLDHLSQGRFILGLGSGELENTVPYGFDFSAPVTRFEEALTVIRLLWESGGPVDFEGRCFRLQHARLDTELFDGRMPPIWIGANGPRMLEIAGRYADGWWPADIWSPDDYASKLATLRSSAERAGRDPEAIVPALIITGFIGSDDELAEIMDAPLVKAYVMQIPARVMRAHGHEHPLGDDWRGFHDIDPGTMTRERVVDMLARVDPEALLDVVPHGTPQQVARVLADYCDAGLRVPKILDYSGMAGLAYGARSAANVRATEDELLRLCGAPA